MAANQEALQRLNTAITMVIPGYIKFAHLSAQNDDQRALVALLHEKLKIGQEAKCMNFEHKGKKFTLAFDAATREMFNTSDEIYEQVKNPKLTECMEAMCNDFDYLFNQLINVAEVDAVIKNIFKDEHIEFTSNNRRYQYPCSNFVLGPLLLRRY